MMVGSKEASTPTPPSRSACEEGCDALSSPVSCCFSVNDSATKKRAKLGISVSCGQDDTKVSPTRSKRRRMQRATSKTVSDQGQRSRRSSKPVVVPSTAPHILNTSLIRSDDRPLEIPRSSEQPLGNSPLPQTTSPPPSGSLPLLPLTHPFPTDQTVLALTINPPSLDPLSSDLASDTGLGLGGSGLGITCTREDLVRYRRGEFTKTPEEVLMEEQGIDWSRMSIADAIWKKWAEDGGISQGFGVWGRYPLDKYGEVYRPELPYIVQVRIVLAAHPRKMMTLPQICQAFMARWPWYRTQPVEWKGETDQKIRESTCVGRSRSDTSATNTISESGTSRTSTLATISERIDGNDDVESSVSGVCATLLSPFTNRPLLADKDKVVRPPAGDQGRVLHLSSASRSGLSCSPLPSDSKATSPRKRPLPNERYYVGSQADQPGLEFSGRPVPSAPDYTIAVRPRRESSTPSQASRIRHEYGLSVFDTLPYGSPMTSIRGHASPRASRSAPRQGLTVPQGTPIPFATLDPVFEMDRRNLAKARRGSRPMPLVDDTPDSSVRITKSMPASMGNFTGLHRFSANRCSTPPHQNGALFAHPQRLNHAIDHRPAHLAASVAGPSPVFSAVSWQQYNLGTWDNSTQHPYHPAWNSRRAWNPHEEPYPRVSYLSTFAPAPNHSSTRSPYATEPAAPYHGDRSETQVYGTTTFGAYQPGSRHVIPRKGGQGPVSIAALLNPKESIMEGRSGHEGKARVQWRAI